MYDSRGGWHGLVRGRLGWKVDPLTRWGRGLQRGSANISEYLRVLLGHVFCSSMAGKHRGKTASGPPAPLVGGIAQQGRSVFFPNKGWSTISPDRGLTVWWEGLIRSKDELDPFQRRQWLGSTFGDMTNCRFGPITNILTWYWWNCQWIPATKRGC